LVRSSISNIPNSKNHSLKRQDLDIPGVHPVLSEGVRVIVPNENGLTIIGSAALAGSG
jgi:hypothetical protein